MFGKLGDMSKMMGQLKEMQKQAKEIKDRLDTISVEGISADHSVKVRMNGNRKVVELVLADEFEALSKADKEFALYTSFNDALEKAENVNESEMRGAAGSIMPGLGGMFGK